MTYLVHTHGGKDVESLRVDLGTTIGHNAHDDLLPGVGTPGTGAVTGGQVANVFHDTMHGSREENFIFLLEYRYS